MKRLCRDPLLAGLAVEAWWRAVKKPDRDSLVAARSTLDSLIAAERPSLARGSARRGEGGGERVAVYLPPELAGDLRVAAAMDRCSLTHIMTEAARLYLAQRRRSATGA